MIKLKKYANGQFFDTINKKYIKVATLKEMIQKGEKVKVTLTKTGKDITASVIEQFAKQTKSEKAGKGKKADKIKAGKTKSGKTKTDKQKADKAKKSPFLNTANLKKWAGKIIDKRITKVLDTIKLPNRKQIEQLDANIKALNKKIDKLEVLQKQKVSKAKSVKKTAAPETKTEKTKEATTKKTDAAQTGSPTA
jgi:polyhydroxyalkanoate synthesis regulator protein